ncbi:MAG: ATP-grasp domain-containing protein [Acidobacteriota bacterium]|nr:ATP-grasp domain-containing protein [Acidobacteriota bacterium]
MNRSNDGTMGTLNSIAGGREYLSGEPTPVAGKKPPVLFATGSSGGTIAAARNLGAAGVRVGVISTDPFTASAWSRSVARSYSGPPEKDSERFLERLLQIGAAEPGQVLLATSDQTAWLYTLNADLLKQYFLLSQASIDSMRKLLDKQLFTEAVIKAGLTVLPSWESRSLRELIELAPTLPYPILIKPRTHVHRLRNDKGLVAHSATELIDLYRRIIGRETFSAENEYLPDASLPVLQQFVDEPNEGVYSVSGYMDRSGKHFVTRIGTKIFQRSRPAGVGICFESRRADPALSAAVYKLCKELNYFGIFEVEFIRFAGNWAAIDFNARLFNQVGMDIRRGMPLPLFAYLEASGQTNALHEAIAKSNALDQDFPVVFYDSFTLRAILVAKTLTGRISLKERSKWKAWTKEHASHAVDFAMDSKDRMPSVIHALSELYLGIKAFPRFLESTPRAVPDTELAVARVGQ